MARAYNFSAGPAALPEPVLECARDEMLDYRGRGLSVMEMSHRSAEFVEIAERAEAHFRELLGVGDDYAVLFLQGGATLQFAMVPINLAAEDSVVDYVHTGAWGTKAIAEARKLCRVNVAASSEEENFNHVPDADDWRLTPGSAYVHITGNETIGGVEFHEYPNTGDTPLVADMSSTLLSRPLDVEKFGLIYASAQKNLGPCGYHRRGRAQGPDRARARKYAQYARLRRARGGELHAEHAVDLCLVPGRTRPEVAQTAGRP